MSCAMLDCVTNACVAPAQHPEPANRMGVPRAGGSRRCPPPALLPGSQTCSCSAGAKRRPWPSDSPCHGEAFACSNQHRQTKEIQASHLLLLLGNSEKHHWPALPF